MSGQKVNLKPKVFSGYSRPASAAQRRKKRPSRRPPPLTVKQILEWADAYHQRTGCWPKSTSSPSGVVGETWSAISLALRRGNRGLPGGSSLPQLLAERRGVRNLASLPALSIEQILDWADTHYRREGEWPRETSGAVYGVPETWHIIESALNNGHRGLPGGSSLARLLAEHRGVRNLKELPRLTIAQILKWADMHHRCAGKWPTGCAGPIEGIDGETWSGIDAALRDGHRGLRGGQSLRKVLLKYRGRRALANPPLSIQQILAWADAYFRHNRRWPQSHSGPVRGEPRENWCRINEALNCGSRGLPGGLTLARLLTEHRGVPLRTGRPNLTVEQVLAWADEHHCQTGEWPKCDSGPISSAPGETWQVIDAALRRGSRGLPAGSSLPDLLTTHRDVRNRLAPPPLTIDQILGWADQCHQRTGRWPSRSSQPVEGVPGETWQSIDSALKQGRRGLHGPSSLAQLLCDSGRRARTTRSRRAR